jgi:hydrogenase nickel incorporation protein HypA/HybF
MHEMSLATSLIAIINEEMLKAKASRLVRVRLKCGALSNVVPESLQTAFEILSLNTPLAGAEVELVQELPLFACAACGHKFSPADKKNLFMPCPDCGSESGHELLAGKGLYIDSIEVEN